MSDPRLYKIAAPKKLKPLELHGMTPSDSSFSNLMPRKVDSMQRDLGLKPGDYSYIPSVDPGQSTTSDLRRLPPPVQEILVPVDKYGQPIRAQLNPVGRGYRTVYVYPDGTRVYSDGKKLPRTRLLRADLKLQEGFRMGARAIPNLAIAGINYGTKGIDWVWGNTFGDKDKPLIGMGDVGLKGKDESWDSYWRYGGGVGLLDRLMGYNLPEVPDYKDVALLLTPGVFGSTALKAINPRAWRTTLKTIDTIKKGTKYLSQGATIASGAAGGLSAVSPYTGNESLKQFGQAFSSPTLPIFNWILKPDKNDFNYQFNSSLIEEARRSIGKADWRQLPDNDWRKRALAQLQRILNIANALLQKYLGALTDPETGKITFKNASKAFKTDLLLNALAAAEQQGILSLLEIKALKSPQTVLNKKLIDKAKEKLFAYLGTTVVVEKDGKAIPMTNNQMLTDLVISKNRAALSNWVTAQLNLGSTQWHAQSAAIPLYRTDTRSATAGTIANATALLSLASLANGGNKKPIKSAFWKIHLPTAMAAQAGIGAAQAKHRNDVYAKYNVPNLQASMIDAENAYNEAKLALETYRDSKKFINPKDETYIGLQRAYDDKLKNYMIAQRAYDTALANAVSLLSISAPAYNSMATNALIFTSPLYRFSRSSIWPLIHTNILGQNYMNTPNYTLYKLPWNMHKASLNLATDGNTGHNAAARVANRPKSFLLHVVLGLGGSGGLLMDALSSIPLSGRRLIQLGVADQLGAARDNLANLIPQGR